MAFRLNSTDRLPCLRRRTVHACSIDPLTSSLPNSSHPTPLSLSLQRASLISRHQSHPQPLVVDPWASHLSPSAPPEPAADPEIHPQILATHHLDTLLLNTLSATSINRVNPGDYRQVVLFTEGFDTRPFRLDFPPGTVIYLISPSECHEKAEAVLKAAGASIPRGCLLRRIDLDLNSNSGSSDEMDLGGLLSGLEKAGYRSDRVSCWVLQGGLEACLSYQTIDNVATLSIQEMTPLVLAQIADLSAYNSILVGETASSPGMPRDVLGSLIAGAGFLGSVVSTGNLDGSEGGAGHEGEGGAGHHNERLVFSSQHMRLSLSQMDVYTAHSQESEGLDEDFGPGNFS